jgi:hypothetical protein
MKGFSLVLSTFFFKAWFPFHFLNLCLGSRGFYLLMECMHNGKLLWQLHDFFSKIHKVFSSTFHGLCSILVMNGIYFSNIILLYKKSTNLIISLPF